MTTIKAVTKYQYNHVEYKTLYVDIIFFAIGLSLVIGRSINIFKHFNL